MCRSEGYLQVTNVNIFIYHPVFFFFFSFHFMLREGLGFLRYVMQFFEAPNIIFDRSGKVMLTDKGIIKREGNAF